MTRLSPKPRSEDSLRRLASWMMLLAALAAVAFIVVISYVLLRDRNQGVAENATTAPQASDTTPIPPTQTELPLGAERVHIVLEGETLIGIASIYNVPVDAIQQANHLTTTVITPGQQLIIPAPLDLTPTAPFVTLGPPPTLTLSPDDPTNLSILSGWPRSLTGGPDADLNANYPGVLVRPRFTLHYQPGTYPDYHINEIVTLVETSLDNVEERLDVTLSGSFNLYAAGTLFDGDDVNIRGFSRSADRQVFVLMDGTSEPAERAYAVTHELTHLVAWNSFGSPASTMLSEGLATYIGRTELEEGGYLPYDQLCLAIEAAGVMPSMAAIDRDYKSFQGHIENRFNYFGAACFVDYLIKQGGLDALAAVYHTSDYPPLFDGRSLGVLDGDWRASLNARRAELTLDPVQLVNMTQQVNNAYDTVFSNVNGTPQMHLAYVTLDKARLALWRGDYPETTRLLAEVYRVSGITPP